MQDLILASASPRRSDLLQQAGYQFIIHKSTLDHEEMSLPPPKGIENLALEKAQDVAVKYESGVILGADTAVIHQNEVLGKPRDEEEAAKMLKLLSGDEHHVITGIALLEVNQNEILTSIVDHVKTRVWMRKLEQDEIIAYINTGEPMDKAGAYGIQEKAAVFVKKLEGCYFNVVGLPLPQVYLFLSRLGIKPWG